MTKIYLSGKISGLSKADYIHNFLQAEKKLSHISRVIINPIKIKPFLGLQNWTCYMITDIAALRKCDKIAMMPNWIDSKGACIEHYFGKFIFKLEVIYL